MKYTPKKFLEGLAFATFIDTYEEWHALVEGFCEVLCPWPAKYQPIDKLLMELKEEHHYYMWGRALGILAWLTIGCIIKVVFF